jgi:hypothetical protein
LRRFDVLSIILFVFYFFFFYSQKTDKTAEHKPKDVPKPPQNEIDESLSILQALFPATSIEERMKWLIVNGILFSF